MYGIRLHVDGGVREVPSAVWAAMAWVCRGPRPGALREARGMARIPIPACPIPRRQAAEAAYWSVTTHATPAMPPHPYGPSCAARAPMAAPVPPWQPPCRRTCPHSLLSAHRWWWTIASRALRPAYRRQGCIAGLGGLHRRAGRAASHWPQHMLVERVW